MKPLDWDSPAHVRLLLILEAAPTRHLFPTPTSLPGRASCSPLPRAKKPLAVSARPRPNLIGALPMLGGLQVSPGCQGGLCTTCAAPVARSCPGPAFQTITRAMGHVIAGVRGTYDRYEYLEEKRKAFDALAGLVGLILNPPAGNVRKLKEQAHGCG